MHRKFKGFKKRQFIASRKATFSDFVSLCPGLVVVEMEGSNKRMERVAVTDSLAVKINLKSNLQSCSHCCSTRARSRTSCSPSSWNATGTAASRRTGG